MFDSYIIIEVPVDLLEGLSSETLNESQWRTAGFSDLYVRIDPERPETRTFRHVHIAHKKHLRVTDRQVSWNIDGSRHDKARFDQSFRSLEQAKQAARRALNLPDNVILEIAGPRFGPLAELLLEDIGWRPPEIWLSASLERQD